MNKILPIVSALALSLSAPALAAGTGQSAAGAAVGTTAAGDVSGLRVLDDDDTTFRDRHGLTADQLEDMDVVTADGERIGEIEDAFIGQNNEIVAVTVETGGFLGVGESKHILGLDQLQLRGDEFVTTMTSEQLEQQPEWED